MNSLTKNLTKNLNHGVHLMNSLTNNLTKNLNHRVLTQSQKICGERTMKIKKKEVVTAEPSGQLLMLEAPPPPPSPSFNSPSALTRGRKRALMEEGNPAPTNSSGHQNVAVHKDKRCKRGNQKKDGSK
ncbi:hypothetical protein PAHAL_4G268600 [Panicum hallii]|uniref:Uncharacterized protein n=1 Tax=Panicum hallii TaxID=206008 RepID=A0A2T8JE30_9POAL|nr:hypothetical protein PAHAL_4G268600 [Panicum hallii]